MCTFFKDWRRKLGYACLIIVIALTCALLRTWTYSDHVKCEVGHRAHEIASRCGGIMWTSIDGTTGGRVIWETRVSIEPDRTVVGYLDGWELGLERFSPRYLCVMYWWLIWPLSLLSAHLILWKPRKSFSVDPLPEPANDPQAVNDT